MHFLLILFVYFVSFLDKPEKTAPQLSERAWAQREKWNIETDQMDYPVSPMYMDSLRHMGIKIFHKSRWFNGVTCEMTKAQADKVKNLDFVTNVEMTRDNSSGSYWYAPWRAKRRVESEQADSKLTDKQLKLFNLLPLHEAGFEGQGILLTVCDGGFYNANTLSCFRHDELELGHFDFTDDSDGFYGYTGDHGTECLSTISGIANNFYGAATKAPYYLMRSEEVENNRESPKEMDNLVVAFETADSLGVNIMSISLGYAEFDNDAWTLPKSALDGKSTRSSLAATIAARKGMLVCVAAGNEGDSEWHTISSPADADSILTVGAVDTEGNIAYFSSYGPSADGRVKPEVCAVGSGTTLINPYGYTITSSGTSFATPLIAGMAACIWSALPDENAMQIRERIIRSANRRNHMIINNQYGYGIPDAWKAYTMQLGEDIPAVQEDEDAPYKIIRGNQVLIIRHGHIYNLAGQRIE